MILETPTESIHINGATSKNITGRVSRNLWHNSKVLEQKSRNTKT